MAKKNSSEKAAMPDLQWVIQQVRDSKAWDFTTKEGLCAYTNECVCALHDVDSSFGHLSKSEGQNHCTDPVGNLTATDVALFIDTGQVVDFIASAGYGNPPPDNGVVWMPGPPGEYTPDKWIEPVRGADSGGGGGDTGGGGGGGVPSDVQAQLDRIEQLATEQKLLLSNLNDQVNLMAGAVNQVVARQDRPLAGNLPRTGDELTLTPR